MGALILMIFTSVYGFNNMPRSFYLMGYGAIPFFLLSAVVFFVPFAFMVAEYGSAFKDEKGGIFSWMQICVGKKYAFVATFMWYTSYVIWLVNIASGIMVPLSNAIFGKDTTADWTLFGLKSTQTLGILGVVFIIAVTFFGSKGLKNIQKVASIGGIACADSLHTLFNTQRPDVLFVILESFSSRLMTALGGEPNIAVHLDSLSKEGVLFTNFYANSFRTDRGLVAILSGYPAQPTTSIMKYPRKTQSIPAIAGSLRKAGYGTKYYYGGDADFTNMRSYLMSSGFEDIVSDQDFPVTERLSKWGAHDHLVFNRLLEDLKAEAAEGTAEEKTPHFRVLQTSSSHEPFEVPFRRLENDRLNAFAYTDSCAGDFVRQFRELPQWKNTVIVFVPDHLGAYPEHIDNLSVERYRIPLLMVGGAVREPRRIDVYGSQHDIAATLLAQLALPHDEFVFSKDMLNPASPHFAFFTVPDAFGMVTADNQVIFNCQAGTVVVDEGTAKGKNLPLGKAYLQKLYDDIAKR